MIGLRDVKHDCLTIMDFMVRLNHFHPISSVEPLKCAPAGIKQDQFCQETKYNETDMRILHRHTRHPRHEEEVQYLCHGDDSHNSRLAELYSTASQPSHVIWLTFCNPREGDIPSKGENEKVYSLWRHVTSC